MTNFDKVTRLEVIDHRRDSPDPGRAFGAWDIAVNVSVQDDGRTLKVFVVNRGEATP